MEAFSFLFGGGKLKSGIDEPPQVRKGIGKTSALAFV
jgi:hypothetical protein